LNAPGGVVWREVRIFWQRQRANQELNVGPSGLAAGVHGADQQAQAATALGGELQAAKSAVIQFFGPTQHSTDAAAVECLMHGPELIFLVARADHDRVS
jgi:hypothetical protein